MRAEGPDNSFEWNTPSIGHADKDGFYVILDRRTGKPIYPIPEVSVPTTPAWPAPWPAQLEGIALEPHSIAKTPKGITPAGGLAGALLATSSCSIC